MKKILLLCCMCAAAAFSFADENRKAGSHSLEFGPDVDIYFLQYTYALTDADFLVAGLAYHNTDIAKLIAYPGSLTAIAGEFGYRRYIWKGLHAEADLLPQYVRCTESGAVTEGFALTAELRAGWQFDFKIGTVPLYFTLQWFAGYYLINPKPQRSIIVPRRLAVLFAHTHVFIRDTPVTEAA